MTDSVAGNRILPAVRLDCQTHQDVGLMQGNCFCYCEMCGLLDVQAPAMDGMSGQGGETQLALRKYSSLPLQAMGDGGVRFCKTMPVLLFDVVHNAKKYIYK